MKNNINNSIGCVGRVTDGDKLTIRVLFKEVGTRKDHLEYLIANCTPTHPSDLKSMIIALDRNAGALPNPYLPVRE